MGQDEEGTLAMVTGDRVGIIEPRIVEHRGRLVKTTGDGVLAEFSSAVDAVRCALAIQETIAAARSDAGDEPMLYRIGINLGDIIVQDGDVFGDGVNVAARLEALAEPGGICISDTVRQVIRSRLDIPLVDLGARTVKNIAEPLHVFRIGSAEAGDISARGAPSPGAPGAVPPATVSTKRPAATDRPSLAVLPFDCYSADPEQQAFADGMMEDLTTDLSKVSGLFVVARNSAQALKGKLGDLRHVAETLGVRYLLEGSVRKAGERVRINAQLIDATTGGHLWADRYDGPVADVFELQDRVGNAVVEALSVQLSQGERERFAKVHTDNLEAYELFVRAKATPYPPIPERIGAARQMFEDVIAMAPDFAGGYAGAAAMMAFGALFAHGDVSAPLARAGQLARKAIDLDETFAWSYTALALVLVQQGRSTDAIEAAGETVKRQPSDADGYLYLGLVTALSGDPAKGLHWVNEAIRLNPRFFTGPYWNVLGQIHLFAGEYEEALAALDTNVRQQGPIGPPALLSRAAACQALGRTGDAASAAAELRNLFPRFRLADWNFLSIVQPAGTRNRITDLMIAAGVE